MRASVPSFGHIRKIPRSTPVVAATSPERWSSFFLSSLTTFFAPGGRVRLRGRTSSGHESRTVEFLFFVQPHHRRTKPRRRRIHVVATANRRCEGRDDARVVASASPTESQTPEEDASTTPVPRLADARGTPSTIDTTMDTSASSFSVTPGSRASTSLLFADCLFLLQQKVPPLRTKASRARWSEKQNRSKAVAVNTRRRIWRQFGRRVATVPKSRVVVSRRRRKTRRRSPR